MGSRVGTDESMTDNAVESPQATFHAITHGSVIPSGFLGQSVNVPDVAGPAHQLVVSRELRSTKQLKLQNCHSMLRMQLVARIMPA